jgi:hypothetical protein
LEGEFGEWLVSEWEKMVGRLEQVTDSELVEKWEEFWLGGQWVRVMEWKKGRRKGIVLMLMGQEKEMNFEEWWRRWWVMMLGCGMSWVELLEKKMG